MNDAPQVTLKVPQTVEAGSLVSLDLDVNDTDSLDSLEFEWQQQNAKLHPIALEGKHAQKAGFLAPESDSGDYDIKLALLVSDLLEPTTTHAAVVHVHCDPNLTPLAKGQSHDWMFDPTNDNLGEWKVSSSAPQLLPSAGLFLLRSLGDERWISHALRHGKFVLDLQIDPQGAKTIACGVRIAYSDDSALNLCFVPVDSEGRKFVSYTSAKDKNGAWSLPPAPERRTLGTWSTTTVMELELTWDGTQLTPRRRHLEDPNWLSGTPYPLPSRPLAVSLFANSGQLGVTAISIRGL